MTFQNYNTKNDAISTLLAGISASATSVQVQSTDGAKFPTGNFIVTLIQYTNKLDRTSVIVKKEKVLVSTNATDTFTITRGFGGDTPTAFETGDTIVLNVVSEVIEDVQDEVVRIENNKLNKGALRTGLASAWRMFFSNGSNNETELSLGASGTVLQSNGATSTPTWEVPSVNINSLSESTSPTTSWFGIFYNGTNNVKVTLANLYKGLTYATTSQNGVVELATDTEARDRVNTSVVMTPSTTNAVMPRTPGTSVTHASGNYSTNSTTFSTVQAFVATTGGIYRVSYSLQGSGGASASTQISINGSIQGELTTSGALVSNTHHITVGRGDTVTIQLKTGNASQTALLNSHTVTSD